MVALGLGRRAMIRRDDSMIASAPDISAWVAANAGAGKTYTLANRVARLLFADALETPGGLKVLTLHAFCQILLSRFPLEAKIPPAFEVLDDQTAREMIDESRQRVLERAGSGDAMLASAVARLVTETSE